MKKPLKTAGIAGIIILISVLVFSFIDQLLIFKGLEESFIMTVISLIYFFILFICTILFAYGFVVLGKNGSRARKKQK